MLCRIKHTFLYAISNTVLKYYIEMMQQLMLCGMWCLVCQCVIFLLPWFALFASCSCGHYNAPATPAPHPSLSTSQNCKLIALIPQCKDWQPLEIGTGVLVMCCCSFPVSVAGERESGHWRRDWPALTRLRMTIHSCRQGLRANATVVC